MKVDNLSVQKVTNKTQYASTRYGDDEDEKVIDQLKNVKLSTH